MFNVDADASGAVETSSGTETAPQPLEDRRRPEPHADVFLPARSRKSSTVRELSITTENTESEGVRVAVRDARDPACTTGRVLTSEGVVTAFEDALSH
jgi:hypothetical protein